MNATPRRQEAQKIDFSPFWAHLPQREEPRAQSANPRERALERGVSERQTEAVLRSVGTQPRDLSSYFADLNAQPPLDEVFAKAESQAEEILRRFRLKR